MGKIAKILGNFSGEFYGRRLPRIMQLLDNTARIITIDRGEVRFEALKENHKSRKVLRKRVREEEYQRGVGNQNSREEISEVIRPACGSESG